VEDVLKGIEEFNNKLEVEHQDRLPYLYGCWKAKKKAFRWISGTTRAMDKQTKQQQSSQQPREKGKRNLGPPKNALSAIGSGLVKILQQVLKTLRTKDMEARGRGEPARFWVLEDIDECAQEFRALASHLEKVLWATYDFTTMYEALEHDKLLAGVMDAVGEAWEYEQDQQAKRQGKRAADMQMVLTETGWVELDQFQQAQRDGGQQGLWATKERLKEIMEFVLGHLYVRNGVVVRRQRKGVPMGLECAPQIANLYGYSVESKWVARTGARNVLSKRFIDDIIVAGEQALVPGVGLPTQEDYAMQYKLTSDAVDSLLYLGVRFFKDENGRAQSVLHDRAVDYPVRIDRYPHVDTVANRSQLAVDHRKVGGRTKDMQQNGSVSECSSRDLHTCM
jgi:hypothetical protein